MKTHAEIDVGRFFDNLDRFAASSPSPGEKAKCSHAEEGECGGFGDGNPS
jgi:hypothetical protein